MRRRLERLEAEAPVARRSPVLLYDAGALPTAEAIQAFRRRQGLNAEQAHVLIPDNHRQDDGHD